MAATLCVSRMGLVPRPGASSLPLHLHGRRLHTARARGIVVVRSDEGRRLGSASSLSKAGAGDGGKGPIYFSYEMATHEACKCPPPFLQRQLERPGCLGECNHPEDRPGNKGSLLARARGGEYASEELDRRHKATDGITGAALVGGDGWSESVFLDSCHRLTCKYIITMRHPVHREQCVEGGKIAELFPHHRNVISSGPFWRVRWIYETRSIRPAALGRRVSGRGGTSGM